MNQKELKELIEYLIEKDIAEFELERGDVKVRIKRTSEAAPPQISYVHAAPQMPAAPPHMGAQPGAAPGQTAAQPQAGAETDTDLHVVKSPIVGTFYESPSPGSGPFVGIGDKVTVGQVVCIVEAMKLMNEIESDTAGEIVKRYVTNGQPVEYGQPLFGIRK